MLSISIIIATRNRAGQLRECLDSIDAQTLPPLETIAVDTSDSDETAALCRQRPVDYMRGTIRSAAIQRNQGAQRARGDLLCFLDDDVVLDRNFLLEIARVFEADRDGRVGGVGGIVNGQSYGPPSRLNRLLLRIFVGKCKAGRLAGPGVNFLPEDRPDSVQRVDWLLSACVAYRREVFLAHRFPESFLGYSIVEDVHLSARIARSHRLYCTTRARLDHKSLGGATHTDWVALGESVVLNRHAVMAYVLGRTSAIDHLRLFGYELLYSTVALVWNGGRGFSLSKAGLMLVGRLRGAAKLLAGRSPHRPDLAPASLLARPTCLTPRPFERCRLLCAVGGAGAFACQRAADSPVNSQRAATSGRRNRPPYQDSHALITVLIVARNRPDELRRTLHELRRQSYRPLELLVIDDASETSLQPVVSECWPEARFVRHAENRGAPASRSEGMRMARGAYVCSLDDDSCFVQPDALNLAVARIQVAEQVGILAFLVHHGAHTPEPVAPTPERYVSSFIGCGHLIRRQVVEALHGYRDFYFYYGEEAEYSLRALDAGWRILFFPSVVVHHRVSHLGRTQSRIFGYSLRNQLFTIVLDQPLGRAIAEGAWKLASYALESVRRQEFRSTMWALGSFGAHLGELWRLRSPVSSHTARLYDALRFTSVTTADTFEHPPALTFGQRVAWLRNTWRHRRRARAAWNRRPGGIGVSATAAFGEDRA